MDVNKPICHFSTTAQRTMNITSNYATDLEQVISSLNSATNEPTEFSLRPVTPNEVLLVMKSLKTDCSTGYDCIPARFIKLVPDVLCTPLAHIINSSINKETFSSPWKIGRIAPIPKIELPLTFGDVRPITILPVLSK